MGSLLVTAGPVQAQRAAENVVRAASDAFGASVGTERIGLYDAGNVRGFSPIDAGNVRLEGFFIDRQTNYTSRLVRGSTIGAGIASQDFLLPAPTGVLNFSLRRAAKTPIQSVFAGYGPFDGFSFGGDFQGNTADGRLDWTGGAGYREAAGFDGSVDRFITAGGSVFFNLTKGVQVVTFADYQRDNDQRSPRCFALEGSIPPNVADRRTPIGQPWVRRNGDGYNVGLLSNILKKGYGLSLGLGRSADHDNEQIGQFITSIGEDGEGDLSIFRGPPRKSVSHFFEAKGFVDKAWGETCHRITIAARGRDRARVFGGTQVIALGRTNLNAPVIYSEAAVTADAPFREDVKQLTLGAAYRLIWEDRGQIDWGVQTSWYDRAIERDGQLVSSLMSEPFLYNASFKLEIAPVLKVYGGIVRGFEEGPIAPGIAANRNEPLPAVTTDQIDAGVQMNVGTLTLLAGVFRLEKPFFSLGQDLVFGQRGQLTNQGIELSVAGQIAKAIQVNVGAVFADPKLDGDLVDSGSLAAEPLALRRRRVTIDLDYRPEWAKSWSFDVGLLNLGDQNVQTTALLLNEGYTTLDLGFRKTFTVGDVLMVLRGRLENVTNTFAWNGQDSGGYIFLGGRSVSVTLAADF